MPHSIRTTLEALARTERAGPHLIRIAIAIVFLWIGALKFAPYEADSITPFVANNPVMSLFYEHPTDYKSHMTHEGELVAAKRDWQVNNNTYGFSNGLGTVEILIALLVLSYPISKWTGLAGAALSFITTIVTLSFLVTTPEAWVPAMGDAQHGFPYLSGAGRLVIKDTLMMAGAWVIAVDAAKGILADKAASAVSRLRQKTA